MENMKEEQKKRIEMEDKAIAEKLKPIKHKIVIMSGKGGVGKTSVAVNLSLALALNGFRVGLLDVDITGPNVPKMLGKNLSLPPSSTSKEGITPVLGPLNMKVMSMGFLLQDPDTPVIWRGPLKMGAIRQFITDVNWGELDFLIVDNPPGTSDEPLSVLQHLKGAHVIIVTTPQEVALLDSRKAVNMAKQMGVDVLGILENMSGLTCPKCGEVIYLFGKGGGEKAAKDLNVPYLGAIPIDPKIREEEDKGEPYIVKHADSEAAKAFDAVVKKIKEILKA
ncbi:MAG: Mrp/NBP35 family ATP-binding protein [Candidatus Helarchaeota archaeon]